MATSGLCRRNLRKVCRTTCTSNVACGYAHHTGRRHLPANLSMARNAKPLQRQPESSQYSFNRVVGPSSQARALMHILRHVSYDGRIAADLLHAVHDQDALLCPALAILIKTFRCVLWNSVLMPAAPPTIVAVVPSACDADARAPVDVAQVSAITT